MKARLGVALLLAAALLGWGNMAWAAGEVGSRIEFSLPNAEGDRISLSDLRGRVVLLDFFATWCRPCKEAIPKLNQLQRAHEAEGLTVLGYSVDTGGRLVVKPFAARNNMEFPIAIGTMEAAKAWGVKVLPTTLVIDPQGKVVDRFEGVVGQERMLSSVKPLLNKQAPPTPASAMVNLRGPDQRRIRHFNFYDNEEINGQKGMVVVVRADMTDQVVEQGLWLQLNLQPLGPGGQTLGEPRPLFQRVDNPLKEQHILFVPCDLLPAAPPGGRLKAWVSILNDKHKQIEKSWEENLPIPCRGGASGLMTLDGGGQPPEGSIPAANGSQAQAASLPAPSTASAPAPAPAKDPFPAKAQAAVAPAGPDELGPRKPGEPRVRRVWVTDNQEIKGRLGMTVHVVADVKGLPGKNHFLDLHLQYEKRSGSGLAPVGEPKVFRRQAGPDDKEYFPMFVDCDQLPPAAEGGVYRAWVTLSDGHTKPKEKSGELVIPRPCQVAAQAN